MRNSVPVSGAYFALVSILVLSLTCVQKSALAEESTPLNNKIEAPQSGSPEMFPWTAMTRRSRTTPPLTAHDERAALEAIHFALREVADGSVFVWRRQKGNLKGLVKPTSSFRDTGGALCRHLQFSVSHGDRTREIESIACRTKDGSWTLSG